MKLALGLREAHLHFGMRSLSQSQKLNILAEVSDCESKGQKACQAWPVRALERDEREWRVTEGKWFWVALVGTYSDGARVRSSTERSVSASRGGKSESAHGGKCGKVECDVV